VTSFERRQRILSLLRQQPGIRVPELARSLGVSEGTVRNDLIYLQQTGALTRVRGGAVVRDEPTQALPLPQSGDAVANQTLKSVIARWAADTVDAGDSILLDASTTVRSMVPYLLKLRSLTVVTHSIDTALDLSENPTHTVILLGGVLRANGKRVLGHLGEANLDQLHVKTAFLSCVGFSPEAGLTESDYAEAQLKRKMIASAERTVALVDSSKFGHVDLTPFARLDQIDRIFTDSDLDLAHLAQLRQACAALTVCDRESVTSFSPRGGKRHYRIGFANLSETSVPFALEVRRGLERAAQAARNVDLVLADNQLSGETALQVADELITRKVDLAIEYQIDERMGSLIMNKFDRANIPVIAVDIPMIGATFFGVNNYQVGFLGGQALGKWVRDHWKGEIDQLFILEETRAGALPAARIQGQLDGLRSVIGEVATRRASRIDSGNTSAISEVKAAEALRRAPDARRIAAISFNDDAAIGALTAARSLGREEHIVVVGQGADRVAREELRQPASRLIGTTAYMPEKYGEQLLEIAGRILAREPVPPAVYGSSVFLTKDNVDLYYPDHAQRG
jgi:ribose transport system substrate-binding protein